MKRIAIAVVLSLVASPALAQTLRRPVACDGCIANWYYFDANGPDPGQQDWNCGSSTYDYHRGNDFSLRGGNGAIDTGYDIVATADGTVVSSEDGHFDRCTTCDASADSRCGTAYGFGYGNHVVINHGSYKVIYGHMRNGSVRVSAGDVVRCGDVIGQIGSSGCTTGAHVHVETRPVGGAYTTAFDPFAGSCSATSPSLWTDQGAYRGMPGPTCEGGTVPPTCPAGTYAIWTCNTERTQRRRCIDGVDMIEDCAYGCVGMPVGTDDVCAQAPDADGDGSAADVDCDDADASRHPGASETCGDGVDQDCDGSDLACPGQDGGVSPIDAAILAPDASTSTNDATVATRDAGVGRPNTLVGGCGCRATSGRALPFSPLALILVLLALRRRRVIV